MQVVQRPVYEDAGIHHLVLVPEAFPQIAQIRHDDDVMYFIQLFAGAVESLHDLQIALQRIIRQFRDFVQFAHLRHAQQNVFRLEARFFQFADLRQPAGTQLLCTGIQIGLRCDGIGPVGLHHAAYVDAAASAAVNDLLRVIPQLCQIDL